MNLLYLTFGDNPDTYIQSQFSIFSFLAHGPEVATINVVTDRPAFYQNLKDRVVIIEADKTVLKEWAGPHDFFWRIKIKAIEALCRRYPGEPVVYLDADTFLHQSPAALRQRLLNGTALMHENEGPLSAGKTKTEKKMWQQAGNSLFGGVRITGRHSMWNAGVVATPNTTNGEDCSLALAICDAMCEAGVTRRLIEQFALSVALEETYGLQPAADTIAHYWSVKGPWTALITQFFSTALFQDLTVEATVNKIRELELDKVPVKARERNTRRRLERLLGKLFPPKEQAFVTTLPTSTDPQP